MNALASAFQGHSVKAMTSGTWSPTQFLSNQQSTSRLGSCAKPGPTVGSKYWMLAWKKTMNPGDVLKVFGASSTSGSAANAGSGSSASPVGAVHPRPARRRDASPHAQRRSSCRQPSFAERRIMRRQQSNVVCRAGVGRSPSAGCMWRAAWRQQKSLCCSRRCGQATERTCALSGNGPRLWIATRPASRMTRGAGDAGGLRASLDVGRRRSAHRHERAAGRARAAPRRGRRTRRGRRHRAVTASDGLDCALAAAPATARRGDVEPRAPAPAAPGECQDCCRVESLKPRQPSARG